MNIRVTAVIWLLNNCLPLENGRTWATCTIANEQYYIRKSYVHGHDDTTGAVRIAPISTRGEVGDWATEELTTWSDKKLTQLIQEIKPGFDLDVWQFQRELQE